MSGQNKDKIEVLVRQVDDNATLCRNMGDTVVTLQKQFEPYETVSTNLQNSWAAHAMLLEEVEKTKLNVCG